MALPPGYGMAPYGADWYAATPLLHALGVHIVSTDELNGIQALERTAPTNLWVFVVAVS